MYIYIHTYIRIHRYSCVFFLVNTSYDFWMPVAPLIYIR